MRRFTKRAFFVIAALGIALASLSSRAAAYAEDYYAQIRTALVPVQNAPVGLSSCKLQKNPIYDLLGGVNAVNRSNRFMESVTVRWTLFNHAGEQMGQSDHVYELREHVAPQDVVTLNEGLSGPRTEGIASIGRSTCRLQAAKFEGGKSWTYGRPWSGKLSPMTVENSSSSSGGGHMRAPTAAAALPAAQTSRFALSVTNAWNDTVGGNLLVHVALDVRGGETDATLRPEMIALTMSLANGAKKAYTAMTAGAPTYEKVTPLGSSSTTAYEVDPKEDLGRLGSVIVPAHGTAHVVATFLVGSDVVANANDNRQVAVQ